jgi:hypothetical protein
VDDGPRFDGRHFVAETQPGPLWSRDAHIGYDTILALLDDFGATVLPFTSRHFGESYPYGN